MGQSLDKKYSNAKTVTSTQKMVHYPGPHPGPRPGPPWEETPWWWPGPKPGPTDRPWPGPIITGGKPKPGPTTITGGRLGARYTEAKRRYKSRNERHKQGTGKVGQ